MTTQQVSLFVGVAGIFALIWIISRMRIYVNSRPLAPAETKRATIPAEALPREKADHIKRVSAFVAKHKVWVFVVCILFVVGWFARYEITTSTQGERSIVYRLDRWTGTLTWCSPPNICDAF